GIRAGTPALTTRGFDEEACEQVADIIYRVVDNPDDEDVKAEASAEVDALCEEYSLYQGDGSITDSE
ncbi:MAG: serine hydroxymethyltransferase, partial [Natronomonas sp.]